MPPPRSKAAATASESAILTKAVLQAAEQLGITNRVLANVIGLSVATVSRMRAGNYKLQRGQKPFELAALFVRLYRSLDAIAGDRTVASAWLQSQNHPLHNRPLSLIQSIPGLVNVIAYLDARRAIG